MNNDTLEKIKEHSLKVYENGTDFKREVDKLGIRLWYIEEGNIEERIQRVRLNTYFVKLKNAANQANIQATDQEILSWIDTMNFLYWTIDKIENNIRDASTEFIIIQEFLIPYTKKRPDYILVSDNKMLILEFSYVNQPMKTEYQYDNKISQAMRYKEMLSSLLPQHIQIGTYTCLIKPERDKDRNNLNVKQSYYNDTEELVTFDDQANLAFYIVEFFDTNKQMTAIEELANKLFDRKTGA